MTIPNARETLFKIIDLVGQGESLSNALSKVGETEQVPNYRYLFRMLRAQDLEEEYFDACQARKQLLKDKLIDELDAIEDTVPAEFHDEACLIPYKFINNTAAIQKLEIKRRIIDSMSGRVEKHRSFQGERIEEQFRSLRDTLSQGLIESTAANNIANVIGKEIELSKYAKLEEAVSKLNEIVETISATKK